MSDREDTSEPLYPNERAFMVKFRRGSKSGHRSAGHVEHVISGRVHRFADTEALVGFMIQMIDSDSRAEPVVPRRNESKT